MDLKKQKIQEYNLNYRRSKRGLINRMYAHMKSRSKKKGWEFNLSKKAFIVWLQLTNFNYYYRNYVKSGYNTYSLPSIDRIDDYGIYEIGNIRVVTWNYNWKRGLNSEKNKIAYKNNFDKYRELIKRKVKIIDTGEEFNSITECAKHINGIPNKITACCKGRRKTHKGLQFEYMVRK